MIRARLRRWGLYLLIGVAVLIGLKVAFNHAACQVYGYQTDRTTRYAWPAGCMIQIDQHWVPRNELRTEQ